VLPIPRDFFYFSDVYLIDYGLLHASMRNIAEVLGYHPLARREQLGQTYYDPRKLSGSMREAEVYRSKLEPCWPARGLKWTHQQPLRAGSPTRWRGAKSSMAAHEGRRLEALRRLGRGLDRLRRRPLRLFRCLTCALALISPAFYLKVYELYNESGFMDGCARCSRRSNSGQTSAGPPNTFFDTLRRLY